jgi:hypothetical protein
MCSEEGLIMMDQERAFVPAEREWMGWPVDVGHSAAGVIETTRRAWSSRGTESAARDDTDAVCAGFAHALFRLILDAKSSSALRARRVRARSRRRAFRQFAV